MWLKLSLSRSSGFKSCNVLPLSRNTGSIFWNTSSNVMSFSASPKIGNSGGVVCWPMTEIDKSRAKKNYNNNYRQFMIIIDALFENDLLMRWAKRSKTNHCNLVDSSSTLLVWMEKKKLYHVSCQTIISFANWGINDVWLRNDIVVN